MFDGKAFGQEIVEVTKAYLKRELAPLLARLDATEKQLVDALAKLAERPDLEALVAEGVAKAIAAQPKVPTAAEVAALVPKADDGKDADPAAVLELVVAEVQKATSGIPVPKDGKDADSEVIRAMVAEQVAALPKPVDGKSVTVDDVRPLVAELVASKVAEIPSGKDGKDADPEVVAGMVKDAVANVMTPLQGAVDAAIADIRAVTEAAVVEMKAAVPTAAEVAALVPTPQDGKSVTAEELRQLVDEVVAAKVAEIPPALPGKDADPEVVHTMVVDEVKAQVAALPVPENGKDASPEAIAAAVEKRLAAWERPKDGKSVTAEEVMPALQDALAKAVAALPAAKDGVGLTGALKDHEGCLVLTLTDGTLVKIGRVDGEPGLGFDDMTEEVTDDGRTLIRRYIRGDQVKEFRHRFAVVLDRGVFKDGTEYVAGDGTTSQGSFWIAQTTTKDRPGTSEAWRLAVKKGRDGQDLRPAEPKPPKPVKL